MTDLDSIYRAFLKSENKPSKEYWSEQNEEIAKIRKEMLEKIRKYKINSL